MSIAERLAQFPELRDTGTWESPRAEDIPQRDQRAYAARHKAVLAYMAGTGFALIEKETKISKRQVYRLVERCITTKPNGTMFGFFGLLPFVRIKQNEGRIGSRKHVPGTHIGLANAFTQLMAEHPALHAYLERNVQKSRGKSAATIANQLHTVFIEKCAKFRAPNEYPFNTGERGRQALTRYIKTLKRSHNLAARPPESPEAEDAAPLTGQPSGAYALRPFEETENDGHNGDFYFVIKALGLLGEWIYTTPMRLWLILLICRGSRALLGYSYRLGSTNYPAIAVMRSFAHALVPWKPKELTIPGLAYKQGAGFPSGVIESARGRMIDLVCFDNAKANTSYLTSNSITRTLGATVIYGRVATPIARPFVERLNQSLEMAGFRRLPVGFNPNRPKKEREQAFNAASEHAVTVEQLEQILDVILANYNADPHSALSNRSPNDYIAMWDAHSKSPRRIARDPELTASKLLRMEYIKSVRGGMGRAPYVQIWNARYSNEILRKIEYWKGVKIRIIADIDGDIRLLRGFIRVGRTETDIGILEAAPPWHLTPHTLQQRQMILRANKTAKIVVPLGSDMVQAFRFLKMQESDSRKSAANELARLGPTGVVKVAARGKRDARSRVPNAEWVTLK